MKRIKLYAGEYAIVDDDFCCDGTWRLTSVGVCAYVNFDSLIMRRVVMNAKKGDRVIHINGDKLDCRRCNLRVITCSQMSHIIAAKRKYKGYKGVSKVGEAYIATLKNKHLGTYKTAEEAARVYDYMALQAYGDVTQPNFPQGRK